MKILIADDDPQILRALRIILGAKGYRVITAANGAEAVSAAVDEQPDMFLLDLGMPQLDGIEVIQGIRGWSQAPILVVSGRTGTADKVQALDTGADDYITKPFAIDELLARIRALTRRIPQEKTVAAARLGDVTVDLATHSVTRAVAGGVKQIRLTPTEWQVMEVLLRNAGKLVTRQTLLTHVWGTEHVQDSGYLRLYISQLRKKLEADPANPRHILTEQGMGYRLVGAEV
ncbi:response regulator [Kocuria rhizophila]|uniref:response regulator n=1 Tax=Kocuria rhizophila TaxID=72000 RepID=UPI000C87BA72|nr:response regulator transcription factor [Kocuria rhizophila]MCT1956807.1 response regulator transcription factor [Kocuria rhizophila]MCT2072727.1 response regulator transcription factor [Kocuria rhizophila]PMR90749.1 DNA-binding response regulator [Kocuria rhizophila]